MVIDMPLKGSCIAYVPLGTAAGRHIASVIRQKQICFFATQTFEIK